MDGVGVAVPDLRQNMVFLPVRFMEQNPGERDLRLTSLNVSSISSSNCFCAKTNWRLGNNPITPRIR